ncbi:hypothetical protein L3556_13930, partial [Candidatus Synechococcus calcipolaris G9]|nr:hypothetical protein [Candidatus Synechococcus calcipolaris G9]
MLSPSTLARIPPQYHEAAIAAAEALKQKQIQESANRPLVDLGNGPGQPPAPHPGPLTPQTPAPTSPKIPLPKIPKLPKLPKPPSGLGGLGKLLGPALAVPALIDEVGKLEDISRQRQARQRELEDFYNKKLRDANDGSPLANFRDVVTRTALGMPLVGLNPPIKYPPGENGPYYPTEASEAITYTVKFSKTLYRQSGTSWNWTPLTNGGTWGNAVGPISLRFEKVVGRTGWYMRNGAGSTWFVSGVTQAGVLNDIQGGDVSFSPVGQPELPLKDRFPPTPRPSPGATPASPQTRPPAVPGASPASPLPRPQPEAPAANPNNPVPPAGPNNRPVPIPGDASPPAWPSSPNPERPHDPAYPNNPPEYNPNTPHSPHSPASPNPFNPDQPLGDPPTETVTPSNPNPIPAATENAGTSRQPSPQPQPLPITSPIPGEQVTSTTDPNPQGQDNPNPSPNPNYQFTPGPENPTNSASACRFELGPYGLIMTLLNKILEALNKEDEQGAANGPQLEQVQLAYVTGSSGSRQLQSHQFQVLPGTVPAATIQDFNQTAQWALVDPGDYSRKTYELLGGGTIFNENHQAVIAPEQQVRQSIDQMAPDGENPGNIQVLGIAGLITGIIGAVAFRQGLHTFPRSIETFDEVTGDPAVAVAKNAVDVTLTTNSTGKAIMTGLKKAQQFLNTISQRLHFDRVTNYLTLITTLHNGAMLSRNLGISILFLLDNALQIPGWQPKDEEGNVISVAQL